MTQILIRKLQQLCSKTQQKKQRKNRCSLIRNHMEKESYAELIQNQNIRQFRYSSWKGKHVQPQHKTDDLVSYMSRV